MGLFARSLILLFLILASANLKAEEALAKVWVLSEHDPSHVNVCKGCDQLKTLSEDVYDALHNFGIGHKNMSSPLQDELRELLVHQRITFPKIGETVEIECDQARPKDEEKKSILEPDFNSYLIKTKAQSILSGDVNQIRVKNGNEEILLVRGRSSGEEVIISFSIKDGEVGEISYHKLDEIKVFKKTALVEPKKGVGVQVKADDKTEVLDGEIFLKANGRTYQFQSKVTMKAKDSKRDSIGVAAETAKDIGPVRFSGTLSQELKGPTHVQKGSGKTALNLGEERGTVSIENSYTHTVIGEKHILEKATALEFANEYLVIDAVRSKTSDENTIMKKKSLGIALTPQEEIAISGQYEKITEIGEWVDVTESASGEINMKGFFLKGSRERNIADESVTVERTHSFGYESDDFGAKAEVARTVEDGETTSKTTDISAHININDILYEAGMNYNLDKSASQYVIISNDRFSVRGEKGKDSERQPFYSGSATYKEDGFEAEVKYSKDTNETKYGASAAYEFEEGEKLTGWVERVRKPNGLTLNRGGVEYTLLNL